jgi:hypothetical protein
MVLIKGRGLVRWNWCMKDSRESREQLRRRYRPDPVRLLFIGESPPASGRFFYRGDSGLYRAMQEAFRRVAPGVTNTDFLGTFRASGCYLIDLSLEPVDHLGAAARKAACLASEPTLTRQILRLRPTAIATLVRSIEGNVARAIKRAGWEGPVIDLPYPGRWSTHRSVFLDRLTPVIAILIRHGTYSHSIDAAALSMLDSDGLQ